MKTNSLLDRMISKPYSSFVVSILGFVSSLLLSFFVYLQLKSVEALKITQLGKVLLSSLSPRMNLFGFSTMLFFAIMGAFMFAITFSKNMPYFKLLNLLGWKWQRINVEILANFMRSYALGYGFSLVLLLIFSIINHPPGTTFFAYFRPFLSAAGLALLIMIVIVVATMFAVLINAKVLAPKTISVGARKALLVVLAFILVAAGGWQLRGYLLSRQSVEEVPEPMVVTSTPSITAVNEYLPSQATYNLDLRFDPSQGLLAGKARIIFTNTYQESLDKIVLRLFPNAPWILTQEGDKPVMSVKRVLLDGNEVEAELSEFDSVLTLTPPQILQADQKSIIEIEYELKIEMNERKDLSWWSTKAFYPILAVYDSQGWRTDVCRYCEEYIFSDAGTYHVTVTYPEGWQMIANGTKVRSITEKDGYLSDEYEGVLLRDFFIGFSKVFTIAESKTSSAYIQIATLNDQAAADRLLNDVAKILSYYSDTFGRYAFDVFTVLAVPATDTGGIPFSAGTYLYYNFDDPKHEFNLASAVAMQWWTEAVGVDFYAAPWQDKSLSSYTALLYLQSHSMLNQSDDVMNSLQEEQSVYPVDTPMSAFESDLNGYFDTVYSKGPLAFIQLEEEIGKDMLAEVLAKYYETYQNKIISPEGLIEIIKKEAGYDFRTLID